MPSPDLVDFEALTAPIPGDDPAGDPKDFFLLRRTLDECRTEHDPSQYPEGTPEHEQEKRDANWNKIFQETKSALTGKCKHLLYAVRMTEALVMMNGFAGVRDSMKLLRLLVENAWDRLHPKNEEPGDEAARIAQLNWLGDPFSGAFYPTKIKKTPIFGSLSWQSWKDSAGDFEAAVNASSTEQCQLVVDDIQAAQTELQGLIAATEGHVPQEPPELGEVARALQDCLVLSQQGLQKKTGTGGAEIALADGMPGAVVTGTPTGAGASREQIYEAINRLADTLERMEPHSPVPMLLKKIVTLGPMRFYDLVAELTRDQKVLDFMKPPETQTESSGNW